MHILFEILPLLIPVLLADIALAVAAVRHILQQPHYRFGNRVMWLVIVVIFLLFGPIIYFVFGKGESE
ncbi:MAG TPA: PLD nuclease N-terminal domain-containing protein [Candidatus Blautia faecipullorum]|nr:PLD nuclease N-terminal domain-containing protein [Candidatus Blautia faecipullorum]